MTPKTPPANTADSAATAPAGPALDYPGSDDPGAGPAAIPPTPTRVKVQLSVMMFLQYAIWGAWLPLIYFYLTHRHNHFTDLEAGLLISIAAVGALPAPFIAGQIADRYFNTEKFLALSHLVGVPLVWILADLQTWPSLAGFALLYSLVYAPTLALTNSLAFHHLADRDRDFGKVRVWGTVGWIVAGITFAQYLSFHHTPVGQPEEVVAAARVEGMADSLRFSGLLGLVMAAYCWFLPKTPPRPGKQKFAAGEALGEIVRSPRTNPLLVLFGVSFFIGCVHQFYFVQTVPLLTSLKIDTPFIYSVFGVGGGGLMTIGQMSELVFLAAMPFFAKRFSRKTLLSIGLSAYVLRFAVFAFVREPWAVIPALALHGVCFGFFFFIAFIVVDEQTSKDVRASAQGLYNLVIVGFGVIVGNLFAGYVGTLAAHPATATEKAWIDFRLLFSVPMWVCVACLVLLLLFYPRRQQVA